MTMDERIDRWLDGELDEEAVAALEADAAADPNIEREMRLAQAARSALASLPRPVCPPEVAAAAKAAARADRPDRAPLRNARRRAAAFAVAVVLIATSLVLISRQPAEPQPTHAEVQKALDDIQFAFAVVADVGKRTGESVRDEVFTDATIRPIRRAVDDVFPGPSEEQP